MSATQLREVDDRLVAVRGDASAVWQHTAAAWKVTGVELARKAMLDGRALTVERARALFPNADLEAIPDLQEPEPPADNPGLRAELDAIEETIAQSE